ncbi:gamma-glutamyl-gamma-aminobutyrate hydrolase family protein [Arenimonas sp.]|jgi:putative glutamine amidotransferase|uniref:gamma-glutamyl-gamma-aminobutyrate hydrolase family protein n=1 Tax=Arenimonas sp. TaxID=1872635 RepID=UPI0037BEC2D8
MIFVGIPADSRMIGPHPFQAVGEKYIRAILDGSGAQPLLIPSVAPGLDLDALLDQLDGLFLPGSPSNIEPHHYSDEPSYEGNLHDPSRDLTTLNLIPKAIAKGVPVLAVCRGFQEVNVAMGGTLHQKVHEVPGMMNHKEDLSQPLDVQYAPAHALNLVPGGWLARWAGATEVNVNSLHGQGLNKLGDNLIAEAMAPDGLVEAIRLDSDDTFLLAVQWHPEWKVTENPFSLEIFKAFGAACKARAAGRNQVKS